MPKSTTSKSKHELIFETSTDALITFKSDFSIDEANPSFEQLSGYSLSDLSGKKASFFTPNPSNLENNRSRPFEESCLMNEGTFEDYLLRKKDGTLAWIDFSLRVIHPLETDGKPLYFLLIRDLSEKKKMERELITKHSELKNAFIELEKAHSELKSTQSLLVQAGKMAALGELTAGISHELNQPLQAIRGYAQETQSLLGEITGPHASEVQSHLKEVITAVDKMRQIIDFLRAFVRKSAEKVEWVDLHQTIDDSFKMLSRQLAMRGIEVVRNYAIDLPAVYANPVQLEQVFINLTSNARDAIDETKHGHGKIQVQTIHRNNTVEVRFSDDGVGMNQRTISKAFNPFFTTKEVGKGMGMGLSLSYGILSKINASIQIESELGKGTTFTIKIPVDFRSM